MLELTHRLSRLKLPAFALSVIALLSMSFAVLTPSQASAWMQQECNFKLSLDDKKINVTCSDNHDNGTLDGHSYTKDGSSSKYKLTQYGATDCEDGITGDTCKIDYRSSDETYAKSCESTLTLESKTKASVSGSYAKLVRKATWQVECQELNPGTASGMITIDSIDNQVNLAKSTAWKKLEKEVEKHVNLVGCSNSYGVVSTTLVGAFLQEDDGTHKPMSQACKDLAICFDRGFTADRLQNVEQNANAIRNAIRNCIRALPSPGPVVNPPPSLTSLSNEQINAAVNAAIGVTNSVVVPQDEDLEDEDPDGTETSCDIDGIGWIVCPIMNALGRWNDGAFKFLDGLLTIQPALLQDDGTYRAWQSFRDIANVAFVIAFLIIIYSQITGAGITNYGIKRMMPRLVIAAILVNSSYVICQIAVDLSNIVGASLYGILGDGIQVGTHPVGTGGEGAWEKWIGHILALGAVALLVIAVILSPTVLLAFAVVLLILVARQAAAILLVVISPLAFVAYLLPNTEDWFKRWRKMFVAVLMVFPIIGLIFGASTLASTILLEVAGDAGNTPGHGNDDEQMLAIMALGVQAIPLFAVPLVLKGSLSALGAVGTRLAGLQDRVNRRSGANLKNAGKDAKNRFNAAAQDPGNKWGRRLGGYSRWSNRRALGRRDRESAAGRAAELGYSSEMIKKDADGEFTKRAARMQRAAAGGIGVANKQGKVRAEAFATQRTFKQWDDDVSAFGTTQTNDSHDMLLQKQNNKSLSVEERAAAAGSIAKRSYRKGHNDSLLAMHAQTSAADDEYRAADAAYKAAEKSGDTVAKAAAETKRSAAKEELDTLSAIQKQFAGDWKDKSFGMGDSSMGALVEGKYGRINPYTDDAGNLKEARSANIFEETRRRTEEKLTAKTVANLNPDDLKIIYNDAVENGNNGTESRTLTDSEMQNLVDKIFEARAHPETAKDIKPEADAKFNEIIDKARQRGLPIPQPPNP